MKTGGWHRPPGLAASTTGHFRLGRQCNTTAGNNPFINASTRISMLSPDNSTAVEAAYLSIFTRRPTPAEASHFTSLLATSKSRNSRSSAMSDLYWTLMNATEFSWNH